jgi:hypothetical protein
VLGAGLLSACTVERVALPERPGCGPRVAEQVEQVRVVVLEQMVANIVRGAAEAPRKLGPILVAEEVRLEPGGLDELYDPSPEVVRHFAAHVPPVSVYSSSPVAWENPNRSMGSPVTIATGAICWSGPTRAHVRARLVLSFDMDISYCARVEQVNGAWLVKSLKESASCDAGPA